MFSINYDCDWRWSLKKGDYMSYAIIRNEKYTKDEMNQLAPHNERYKKKYSNKNIDLSRTNT